MQAVSVPIIVLCVFMGWIDGSGWRVLPHLPLLAAAGAIIALSVIGLVGSLRQTRVLLRIVRIAICW